MKCARGGNGGGPTPTPPATDCNPTPAPPLQPLPWLPAFSGDASGGGDRMVRHAMTAATTPPHGLAAPQSPTPAVACQPRRDAIDGGQDGNGHGSDGGGGGLHTSSAVD